ncbi:hypothetical protein [Terriglobus sp. TAA 43]|uniref:PP_RS20740 family protein n=1 Tax=Terriglobus sp. TAA 43 TaxID=278961 RepID=UPI000649221E|nr:hypothetical protein [Terriglobus sp. TAA 43]
MAENEQEDLAADIIGAPAYEAPRPTQKEFLPWHRPRKQYVRVEQWCAEINRMIQQREEVPASLKYLGLPGIDLLDLRHIHKMVCTPKNLAFSFLGFNTALASNKDDQTEINISLDEVRRLPLVEETSDVLKDDVCLLGDKESIAFQRARAFGPFDVINLDLCDGFGKQAPGALTNNHYRALAGILKIQLLSKTPWLLLLTTRVGQNDVHQELLDRFVDVYGSNLDNHDSFRKLSSKVFGIAARTDIAQKVATEKGHADLFLTGLCKWMSNLAITNSPKATIDVRSVMGYQVAPQASCEDLISIAIEFTPHSATIVDPSGVIVDPPELPNEAKMAMASLKKVAERADVDRILVEDPPIHDVMLDDMKELLEAARYDISAYLDWLTKERASSPILAT